MKLLPEILPKGWPKPNLPLPFRLVLVREFPEFSSSRKKEGPPNSRLNRTDSTTRWYESESKVVEVTWIFTLWGISCIALGLLTVPGLAQGEEYFEEAPLRPSAELGFALKHGRRVPAMGQLSVLTIYAQFADDQPRDDALPADANGLFDPKRPGSFTHFYHTLSLDQLQIHATVLPKRYTSDQPARAYAPTRTPDDSKAQVKGFGQFVLEILRQVDADHDLAAFDNDGPDGVPNSGDDDGFADFVFVILRSRPPNFLLQNADGVASLGFENPFISDDPGAGGQAIGVRGDDFVGAVLLGKSFAWTAGVMAHEFGHALGKEPLPDLVDRSHLLVADQAPADYSAGIGRWGLMGQGTLGWQSEGRIDGPNAFSGPSLKQLGWIRPDNGRLVEIRQDTTDLRIGDPYKGGTIYKIPLRTPTDKSVVLPEEYLLLEYRGRATHYHRNDPGTGLLVWRIQPIPFQGTVNDLEADKQVDLVCADGLYTDAGFDLGRLAAPNRGFDNLDFWAPNQHKDYRVQHRGNSGDKTDLFAAPQFTTLDANTNPANLFGWDSPPAYRGPTIRIVEHLADAVVVDIELPRWAGEIRQKVYWAGDILVDGDLRIAPEGELVLYPTTRVLVAGRDRLQGGRDSERVEIDLQGELTLNQQGVRFFSTTDFHAIRADSFVFAAAKPGEGWLGIFSDQPLDELLVLRDVEPALEQGGALNATVVETGSLTEDQPKAFALGANYPNPFDTATTLPYTLAAASEVQLIIYNSAGQMVRHLVDDQQQAGAYEVVWRGTDESGQTVATGVYLYQLQVPGHFSGSGKMLFLPGGFSRFSSLDSWLRGQGEAGANLISKVIGQDAPALGFTPTGSTDYAAFAAGQLLTNLLLQAQSGGPNFTRTVDRLKSQIQAFAPDGRRAVESQLQRLEPSTPNTVAALERELGAVTRNHGETAALYYNLGTWLQPLKIAAQIARRMSLPLGAIVDLPADATTARHFGQALQSTANGEALAAELERLAEYLQTEPSTFDQLGSVLGSAERIEAGIRR